MTTSKVDQVIKAYFDELFRDVDQSPSPRLETLVREWKGLPHGGTSPYEGTGIGAPEPPTSSENTDR